MAVAPMLKLTVLGYRPVMDETVRALQTAGVVEVEATSFDLPSIEVAPDDERLRRIDEQIAEARFVLDFLGRHHKNEQPFSIFVAEKFHFDTEDYRGMHFDARMRGLYHECVSIADRLASGERERARLVALVQDLEPWTGLRTQIREWRNTEHTVLFTGTVPAREGSAIRDRLRQEVCHVTVEEAGPVGDRQAWVVIAHRSCLSAVRSTLAVAGFVEVSFPQLTDYPAEEKARAEARIAEIDAQEEKLEQRVGELSGETYHRAYALVQALESERERLLVRKSFGSTERLFTVSGWVRESCVDELQDALAAWSGDIDLTLEKPQEGDSVPIELDNPKWLRPLEVLTDLYGRPQYHEMDPTLLLAPFFLAFFGICIGDVGYGLMLIVGCWLVKTKLDVAPGVKKFCTLMMYGGAAAMIMGVFFGSYLAIPLDDLPALMTYEKANGSLRVYGQLLDPLGELTTFLIFTVVLGVLQVFFGVIVAAFDAFRRKDPAEAVFGQLSTLFLFVMIAATVLTGSGLYLSLGLVGTMLMQGRAIEAALGDKDSAALDRVMGIAWLAAVIASAFVMGLVSVTTGLLVLAGASLLAIISKTARKAFLGLLGGAYAVYGMSALAGDILSYTRLAALGLSGSLVGFVFNLLAGLVWEPAMTQFSSGGAGILFGAIIAVLAAAVFIVGHVFNVVINLLGAFVHPARLQFVEFFSKFYEGGGRPLEPFRYRADNLVLDAGGAGTEGGAGK